LKWFDLTEENEPDSDGLSGVVHFISDPESSDGGFTFIVDLGSASIDAFGELLDCLIEMGVETCLIGARKP
jgi:hypothetical protein